MHIEARIQTRCLRKVHSEELHDVYSSSSNIIRVTKSRRIRWAGHVACMEKRYIQDIGGEIRRIT
jgi:hypothetical protein